MLIKKKKGIQLNQAFGAILTLVLVAVLVIIGIVLFVNLISGPFVNIVSVSVIDEVITPVSDPGATTANATFCNFGSFSVATVTNTTGSFIAPGNYSTDATAGTIQNITPLFNGTETNWLLNYSYQWGSAACTASQDMITQFGTYPVLVGLVGTIIFLGLVIGVLVSSFAFGRRRGI